MQELKTAIQSARITRQHDGSRHLMLVAANELQAGILRHTLGDDNILIRYSYDGFDITWYLLLELTRIGKMLRIPVNATEATLKWLDWLDEKSITAVRAAYYDGKGGVIPFGDPVSITADTDA